MQRCKPFQMISAFGIGSLFREESSSSLSQVVVCTRQQMAGCPSSSFRGQTWMPLRMPQDARINFPSLALIVEIKHVFQSARRNTRWPVRTFHDIPFFETKIVGFGRIKLLSLNHLAYLFECRTPPHLQIWTLFMQKYLQSRRLMCKWSSCV